MTESLDPIVEEKRPDAITALGVLGFINTILFSILFGFAVMGTAGLGSMDQEAYDDAIEESMQSMKGSVPAEDMTWLEDELFPWFKQNGFKFCLVLLGLTVIRFFSILQLWRRQKAGLPIYAGAQILRVLVPVFMIGAKAFQPIGAILAAGMVVGWFTQRKYLR